jgi:hypothetical protein
MPKFQAPPIRTFFLGNPPEATIPPPEGKHTETPNIPAYAWINWFQAITDQLSTVAAPATSTSPGLPGQITYDSNFLYVAIAKNQWKRVALVAF